MNTELIVFLSERMAFCRHEIDLCTGDENREARLHHKIMLSTYMEVYDFINKIPSLVDKSETITYITQKGI